MATRAELMREITRLRSQAGAQFSRLEKAIQRRELPKSARGTYFYDVIAYQKRNPEKADLYLKLTGKGVKIPTRKSDQGKDKISLESIVERLTKLVSQETATISGTKERIKSQEESADYLLNLYGLDPDQIDGMTRYQKSRFFQLATLIMEEHGLDSDTAFREVAETMNDTGKKAGELFREYSKNGDKFIEKYGISKGKQDKQ